jgi:WD40 repeat protein
MVFSPDGKKLATGDESGRIKIWNMENGAELCTVSEHAGFVKSLSFSPDGKMLVSAGRQGTIDFWNANTGKELCSVTPIDQSDWVVLDRQGHFDGSPGAMELVHSFKDGKPLEAEQMKKQCFEPNLFKKQVGGNREAKETSAETPIQ